MKEMREAFTKLFEVAFDFMAFNSGDGVSLIVSDDYLKIAYLFEKWADENHPNYFNKVVYKEPSSIVFNGHDEEGIVFAGNLEHILRDMYEFICIL